MSELTFEKKNIYIFFIKNDTKNGRFLIVAYSGFLIVNSTNIKCAGVIFCPREREREFDSITRNKNVVINL